MRDGELDLDTLMSVLRQRGLFAVFVEGGGKTVSHFLRHGLLNHLQVAVARWSSGRDVPGSGSMVTRISGLSSSLDPALPNGRRYAV